MDLAEPMVLGVALAGPIASGLAALVCGLLSYHAWLAALERLASRRDTRRPRALAGLSVALALAPLLLQLFLALALGGVLTRSLAVLALLGLGLLLAGLNLAHACFRWTMIDRAEHHPRSAELERVPHAAGRDVELRRVAQAIGLRRWRDVLRISR